jgi:hypothetical protein
MLRTGFVLGVSVPAAILTLLLLPVVRQEADAMGAPTAPRVAYEASATPLPGMRPYSTALSPIHAHGDGSDPLGPGGGSGQAPPHDAGGLRGSTQLARRPRGAPHGARPLHDLNVSRTLRLQTGCEAFSTSAVNPAGPIRSRATSRSPGAKVPRGTSRSGSTTVVTVLTWTST